MKEVFLQDIQYKTMFDEVYKHQMKLNEDRERENRQRKQEEVHQKYQEQQEKHLMEERKRAEANKKTRTYQEEFLKL